MKKTTKRLVSSILATSMLLSSVLTSNVLVSAEELDVVETAVEDTTATPAAVSYSEEPIAVYAEAEPFTMKEGVTYIKASLEGEDGTGVETIDSSMIGSTVNIDFSLLQNPGFSSATFYVCYDPKVLQATAGNIPKKAELVNKGYITYTYYDQDELEDVTKTFFSNADINSRINYKPVSGSEEYPGADGTLTSAELGKIKLGKYEDKNIDPQTSLIKAIEGDGKIISIAFKVIGEGDAKVDVEVVKFGYAPVSAGSKEANATPIPIESYPNNIAVGNEVTTEATTEATTAEATTKAVETTEATTKAVETTQATTKAVETTQATTKAVETTQATTKAVETTQATTKAAVVTTKEATTEATTQATTVEATTKAAPSSDDEATTKAAQVTTKEAATEATTQATTKASESATKAADRTTETTTASSGGGSSSRSASSGGGGGGGSSVRKSTTTTTVAEDDTETTTASSSSSSDDATEATTESVDAVTSATPDNWEGLFDDLSDTPWAEEAVNALAEMGILNGVADRTFAPKASCKRADFAIMLVKTLGIDGTATSNFDDVLPDKYYYNYVGLAKDAGIVNGYGNGKFGPENFCTRAELMVMVANALGVSGIDITADESVLDQFSDAADIPAWARPYIAYLVEDGIVSGSNNKINPNVNITRAEVAVIMYNVVNALNNAGVETEDAAEEATGEIEVGEEVAAYEDAAYEDASYTEALNTKSAEEIAEDAAEEAAEKSAETENNK